MTILFFVNLFILQIFADASCDSSYSTCVSSSGAPDSAYALLQVQHTGTKHMFFDAIEHIGATASHIGATAPLNETGYLEVKQTCCNAEMLMFARRIVDNEGLELCSKWGLMGLVPWFTCDQGEKALGFLQSTLLLRHKGLGDIEEQLAALKNSQLRKKAASLGVPEDKLDEAEDSRDPRAAFIDLIISTQDDEQKRMQQLASLHNSDLREMVTSLNVDTTKAKEAEDADDPRAAYIELILAKEAGKEAGSVPDFTYARLREEILASQPPAKCSFVALPDSCPTGQNLGTDCHGIDDYNDYSPCADSGTANPTTSVSTSSTTAVHTTASTTAAPTTPVTLATTVLSTTPALTTTTPTPSTTAAPTTAAATTVLSTTPALTTTIATTTPTPSTTAAPTTAAATTVLSTTPALTTTIATTTDIALRQFGVDGCPCDGDCISSEKLDPAECEAKGPGWFGGFVDAKDRGSAYPSGCFVSSVNHIPGTGYVLYNTNNAGQAHEHAAVFCKTTVAA